MSLRIFGQASVSMNQIQQQIDLISNNLANMQTPGYKSRGAEFSSLLFQHINNLSDTENLQNRQTPDGIRVGVGARLGSTNANFQVGAAQKTDRALDVMLTGENHFFQIQVSNGDQEEIRYTRDGSFYLQPINDNIVMLVTKDGHPVLGMNGPIQVNGSIDSIHINNDGSVIVNRAGQEEVIGTIAVSEITQPRLLESVGDNLFRLPNLADLGFDFGEIVQIPEMDDVMESGTLEMANVNIAEQMTQLMTVQRAYQFNARSISMADQMQGLINQIR